MAPEIIFCENFSLDFKEIGPYVYQLFLQDLDYQMKYKIYFYLKKGLRTT